MKAALASSMMATDLADYLVRKGHDAFARRTPRSDALVRQSEVSGVELHALPLQGVQGGARELRRRCVRRTLGGGERGATRNGGWHGPDAVARARRRMKSARASLA